MRLVRVPFEGQTQVVRQKLQHGRVSEEPGFPSHEVKTGKVHSLPAHNEAVLLVLRGLVAHDRTDHGEVPMAEGQNPPSSEIGGGILNNTIIANITLII